MRRPFERAPGFPPRVEGACAAHPPPPPVQPRAGEGVATVRGNRDRRVLVRKLVASFWPVICIFGVEGVRPRVNMFLWSRIKILSEV